MAGALGFEPRMPVPKTSALPLGYAPILISYNIKKKNYIVFDAIHQMLLNFLLNWFNARLQAFLDWKYAIIDDPDPVILTKIVFGIVNKNDLIFFNFGYFLNTIISRSLFKFFK